MDIISATDAKNHFSSLLEKAQKHPVTIERNGRPVAVVLSAEDYARQDARDSRKGGMTGEALLAAMQASPYKDKTLESASVRAPVRDVSF